MSDEPPTVVPLRPEFIVADEAHPLFERIVRRFSEFTAEHGVPVAYALVLRTADGQARAFAGSVEPDLVVRRDIAALGSVLLAAKAIKEADE